jgi:hypothetical protein
MSDIVTVHPRVRPWSRKRSNYIINIMDKLFSEIQTARLAYLTLTWTIDSQNNFAGSPEHPVGSFHETKSGCVVERRGLDEI